MFHSQPKEMVYASFCSKEILIHAVSWMCFSLAEEVQLLPSLWFLLVIGKHYTGDGLCNITWNVKCLNCFLNVDSFFNCNCWINIDFVQRLITLCLEDYNFLNIAATSNKCSYLIINTINVTVVVAIHLPELEVGAVFVRWFHSLWTNSVLDKVFHVFQYL